MIWCRPRSRIQRRTRGSKRKRSPVLRGFPDSARDEVRCLGPLAEFGGIESLVVAVGAQDVLSVAVPVDEELDALLVA
jgi:hypothetical protein